MRTSTKLIRLCSVVPTGLAGSVIALMTYGFLPDAGEFAAWAGELVLVVMLSLGLFEAMASRLLGFARSPTPGERALLDTPVALAKAAGLRAGRLLIRRIPSDGPLVAPIGRHTLLVDPWLVDALYRRSVSETDAAAALAHAVASLRVGPARLDLAARLWAFPWTVLRVAWRLVAGSFSGGVSWGMRSVVGGVALVQGFQRGGDPAVGIGAAVLVAVSYIAPAADNAWRGAVARDADRVVARHGMGEPLVRLAQSLYGTKSLERVHRIRSASTSPVTAPVTGEVTGEVSRGGELVGAGSDRRTPAALSVKGPASRYRGAS